MNFQRLARTYTGPSLFSVIAVAALVSHACFGLVRHTGTIRGSARYGYRDDPDAHHSFRREYAHLYATDSRVVEASMVKGRCLPGHRPWRQFCM